VVTGVALLPAAGAALGLLFGGLGANPVETVTHITGEWTLRLLLLTLAVTPARRWLGLSWLTPYRRTLGLLAFTYGCLHLLTWLALDWFFDWGAIWEDIVERPFVTAGMAAFLCMLPLAATSTRRAIRRLGRRWVALHRLAYLAAVLGVVHFLWQVKADLLAPAAHAAVLALLLAARLRRSRRNADDPARA
jgi:sulfoxide reductase heme-binding subunit YedZ